MLLELPPEVPPDRNGRNYSGVPDSLMRDDNLKHKSGHNISNTDGSVSMGVQGYDGKFTPIACTDCGRDNLGTLITSSDNKPRCIRCHDKFMMVHDIPKCVGCGEPTPFGHKIEGGIHCDVCYHNLLANKLKSQINDLTDNDHEPAWDDFDHFSSFDNSDSNTDYPWEVASAVYDSNNAGLTGKLNKQAGLAESKNINKASQEPKDIGETHMTPDRMKVLQDLQQASFGQRHASQQRLSKAQRELLDRNKYVTEHEFDARRDEILSYDFDEPTKASKARKPKKETKVGGWLSKLTSSIKEGWAEMMEEKEVVEEKEVEENVNETGEIKIDEQNEAVVDEQIETKNEESSDTVESETTPIKEVVESVEVDCDKSDICNVSDTIVEKSKENPKSEES